jgi:predicted  nucleic acid-binding Zn-ribbon protein
MGSLDGLLDVQTLDTHADQLRHRRETLPERAALDEALARRTQAAQQAEVVRGRLHDLRSRQKALEDDAALVEDKAAEVERKLYDGSVQAHKELEAFQADHRMLKARQSELEDGAIELMEAAEPVEAELDALDAAVAEQDREAERLTGAIAGAESTIDAEVDDLAARRQQAAAALPDAVMEAYEQLRRGLGGVGAARLTGARCEGCHLEIPSAELEAVRRAPEDAVVTCPECGRLLVR